MPKYKVYKRLDLVYECEATDAADAEKQCIEADDTRDMWVADCQYDVYRQSDDGLDETQEYPGDGDTMVEVG